MAVLKIRSLIIDDTGIRTHTHSFAWADVHSYGSQFLSWKPKGKLQATISVNQDSIFVADDEDQASETCWPSKTAWRRTAAVK